MCRHHDVYDPPTAAVEAEAEEGKNPEDFQNEEEKGRKRGGEGEDPTRKCGKSPFSLPPSPK